MPGVRIGNHVVVGGTPAKVIRTEVVLTEKCQVVNNIGKKNNVC